MAGNATFAHNFRFAFPLLCDVTRQVCLAYGACSSPQDAGARRITYVIGPAGTILQAYHQVNPVNHIEQLLAFLDSSQPTRQSSRAARIARPVVIPPVYTPRTQPSPPVKRNQVRSSPAAPARGALVYALGKLGYDFGSESRRDVIRQGMLERGRDLSNPHQLLAHLGDEPEQAQTLIWTLEQDETPIYAIEPRGPFADQTYQLLGEFLGEQLREGVERISLPGVAAGRQVQLLSGQQVPVVIPDLPGMHNWTTDALLEAVRAASPATDGIDELRNFLQRVYDELRNRGVTPQERALNQSATNAMYAQHVFESATRESLALEGIGVQRSPYCREGSSCWDVTLTFFDPKNRFRRAKRVYRFTVDVSNVIPVAIGPVRSWSAY